MCKSKSWDARDIQVETLGAVRECMLTRVARLKRAAIDDDVEEEINEEVLLDACYFLYRISRPGSSPMRRRTKRDVLKHNCNKNTVLAEDDNVHVMYVSGSSWIARLEAVQISSRVVRENCRRFVFLTRDVLLVDSGQTRSKREQVSTSEQTCDCSKPGQLQERRAVSTREQTLWLKKRWSKWESSTTRMVSTCVQNW